MSPTNDLSGCKFPGVKDLDDLIARLHEVFESDHVNVEYVENLMKSYKSNVSEWKKFAKFDQYRYTRNLVDEGNGKFNLLIVAWEGGHASGIHDHSDSHCFMKILDGNINEVRFAWPERPDEKPENLNQTSTIRLETNSVSYMNDSLGIHKLENASHVERAVSLHLYCPPFNSCQVFDQKTGHKTKCQVTFWSRFGERTPFGTKSSSSVVPPGNN